ncbi:biotin carboxyl carrier protein [Caldalkalibacillus uzonensis]|uniref:Biotin carboxyl carrier protein n=1 Tax=Caldalkalibacillus uzonensis TaxID=353224 RepID=A0ABU0CXX0_9BACI|nr:hypothetical protein [Caldalkalibacillus uzonensis]MDQ0340993.1 biotin carboxyl carrier protein [Caldalkalibacillus uzonensis]
MIHRITSPYEGTIEKVLIQEDSYVYEWEALFLIKTFDGNIQEVDIGASGFIISLEVKKGDWVTVNTTLAYLKDDMVITGSD